VKLYLTGSILTLVGVISGSSTSSFGSSGTVGVCLISSISGSGA